MKLVNLTPHTMKISGHPDVEPSGYIARVNTQIQQVGSVNGVPLMTSKMLGLFNVPDPAPDTMYIVSGLLRLQLPERKDLVSPSKMIRNEHGAVVACGALEVNP